MILINFLLGCIQVFLMIWDFLTLPFYVCIQQPWREQRKKNSVRASIISNKENEVTVRAKPMKSLIIQQLRANSEEINTMERLFKFCVKKHGERRCLGSRTILGEEEEKQPNGKVFTKLQLGEYKWMKYSEVQSQAESIGKGLIEVGLKPKDKVVLYANTSAEWMIFSIACFKHSLSIVTIYTNLGEDGVIHGLQQTEAAVVVTSQDLLTKLTNVLPSVPSVKTVIIIPGHKPCAKIESDEVQYYKLQDIVLMGSRSEVTSSPPVPEDSAIIMYTSGSTGVPKGVVLTHKNILQAVYCFLPTITEALGPLRSEDAYIAYLPLAHVLELAAENLMLVMGIPIGYATTNTLLDSGTMVAKGSKGDITELKPTAMCAVPLVLDRIYKGLQAGVKKQGPFKEKLVRLCYRYRLKWTKRGYNTPIMDRLVFTALRRIVGGRIRVLLSGGAPLAPDAHDYCRTVLGITLLQGYGLTETTATATITDSHDYSTGRVGPPLQEVDIKLVNWDEGGYTVKDKPGPRGEIIIGGGNVAKEYYDMPDKTEEEFYQEDNRRWFKTGDIGQLFEDGTLKIIDRKKDLVKLQGGEYVSLGKVESLLKIHPLVENICVYGDPGRFHVVCLIVPDQNNLAQLAEQKGKGSPSREDMCRDKEMVKAVLQEVQKHATRQKLAKFEIPQSAVLVSEPWSPESGLVTAAMKLKRKSIESAFKDDITDMYDGLNNNSSPKKDNNAT